MADRVGEHLGAYHLIRLLARSPFAEVYLTKVPFSKTLAVLKVLLQPHTPEEIERVHGAVLTLARLTHPSLLPIRDFGIVDTHPYLVMDYAPHGSLRTRAPRGTILDMPTLLSVLKHLVPAVQFAHEHNLVHGNIKPENILLDLTHTPLLSDLASLWEQQTGGQGRRRKAHRRSSTWLLSNSRVRCNLPPISTL